MNVALWPQAPEALTGIALWSESGRVWCPGPLEECAKHLEYVRPGSHPHATSRRGSFQKNEGPDDAISVL